VSTKVQGLSKKPLAIVSNPAMGAGYAVTLQVAGNDTHRGYVLSTTVTVPLELPQLTVMVEVPCPLVIVPPYTVQLYIPEPLTLNVPCVFSQRF
jgi:hypothetical protein